MKLRGFVAVAALAIIAAAGVPLATRAGGEPLIADGDVAPAAASSTSPSTAGQPVRALANRAVRFRQRPALAGDRVAQRLGVELNLETRIVQSGQIAHESTNEMRRQQHRTIEVQEVVDGRAVRAKASFEVSQRQSPENADPTSPTPQPIEGKSYLMQRTGDELKITDLEGNIPPADEFKLLVESLENVGKPNPLAQLLADRSLAIGERLHVPREMVKPLLGLGDELGRVHRFELTLVELDSAPGATNLLAVFEANIQVLPDEASPLGITLDGRMTIDSATCRLVAVDLAGPVQISTIERTAGGIFQYSAGGQLHVAIQSQYDRATK